jgi:hypothetical protein
MVMENLLPEQRAKVEKRVAELISEEMTLKDFPLSKVSR